MPQLTETLGQVPRPHCSREQAREMLESLRTAYQSLSFVERGLFKNRIFRAQREQTLQEIDE